MFQEYLAVRHVEAKWISLHRLTKDFMWSEPDSWHALMSKIAEVVRRYLRAQVDAGAQALQLGLTAQAAGAH